MAAKTNGSGDDGVIAEINIVPFVDIILVVLIIFMATTPLIMKPSINVNLPKAASSTETAPSQLSITVSAGGEIILNGRAATLERLTEFAKAQFEKDPNVQAIIAADKETPHGQVISVLDAVKTVGISKFAISIDKK